MSLKLHSKSLVVDSIHSRIVMPYSKRVVDRAMEMVEMASLLIKS
jgi:hypothetical protein